MHLEDERRATWVCDDHGYRVLQHRSLTNLVKHDGYDDGGNDNGNEYKACNLSVVQQPRVGSLGERCMVALLLLWGGGWARGGMFGKSCKPQHICTNMILYVTMVTPPKQTLHDMTAPWRFTAYIGLPYLTKCKNNNNITTINKRCRSMYEFETTRCTTYEHEDQAYIRDLHVYNR